MTAMRVSLATFSDDFNDYMALVHQAIPISTSFVIIVSVLLLVSAAVFIWAAVFRKRRRPKYHYPRTRHEPGAGQSDAPATRWSLFSRKRHRRRRRSRPRNPTLAEAGGLPPVRGGSEATDPE